MIGSAGAGEPMPAQRLPTILPPRTPSQTLETTRIDSAMGRLSADEPFLKRRPSCTPGHAIGDAGMVGGGRPSQATRRRRPRLKTGFE